MNRKIKGALGGVITYVMHARKTRKQEFARIFIHTRKNSYTC